MRGASRLPAGALFIVLGVVLPAAAELEDPVDRLQRALEQSRGMEDAEIHARLPALAGLVGEYFRAYGVHVPPRDWLYLGSGNEQDPAPAVRRTLDAHLRAWHPVAGLLFLELLIADGPAGMYARMLDLEGKNANAAIAARIADSAREIEAAGSSAEPRALAERMVRRQIAELWELLRGVAQDHVGRILEDNLRPEPRRVAFDGIGRVAKLLESNRQRDRVGLWSRLREPAESAALAATLSDVAVRVLIDSGLPGLEKRADLARVLDALVLLQTRQAADRLILLFDQFDDYRRLPDVGEYGLEALLVASVGNFVGRSVAEDPEKVLALELIDHLNRLVIERLRLESGDLVPSRVIAALDVVRRAYPGIGLDYLERFHSDFHALDPAGYEALIFRLTDILVDFAEHGMFLREVITPGGLPLVQGRGPQQQVMDVLVWYNRALLDVPTLPDIDVSFMHREQRAVLDRIYGYFEMRSGTIWELQADDPRLVETLLILAVRVAHAAPRGDIVTHILRPLTQIEWAERRLGSGRALPATVREQVDLLWMIVGADERRKLYVEFALQK